MKGAVTSSFYWLRSNLIFIFLFQSILSVSQTENRLVHPLFTDEPIYSFFINDSTVRVLTITDQNNGYGGRLQGYIDITTSSLYELSEPKTVQIPAHWFNQTLDQINVLQLKGGEVIIANTQFDCDYPPPGGILRLDNKGDVNWFIDFIEEEIYFTAGQMVFIDTNTILITDYWDEEQQIIIDKGGNIIDRDLPDTIYTITIETDFGFLTAVDDQLEILDTNFHRVLSYTLGGPIKEITNLNTGRYLVRTENLRSYIYYDSMVLEDIPISQFERIIGFAKEYWTVNGMNTIFSYDSLFQPVDTQRLSPGVKAEIIMPVGDELVSINRFSNFNGTGTLLFKGTEEEINLSLPQDIGITGLSIPDTVTYKPYSNYPWGIEFTIDSIWVNVTNFGSDTVTKFNIQLPFYWSCYWCHDYTSIWKIDSLVLAPGANENIFLGSFYSDCIQGGAGNWTLCLSTIAPNDKADGNYLNDTTCQKIRLLYTGTEHVYPDETFKLYPVPAEDVIYVRLNEKFIGECLGSIYDLSGKLLDRFPINEQTEKVELTNLPSGIYFMVLGDPKGGTYSRSFQVSHR